MWKCRSVTMYIPFKACLGEVHWKILSEYKGEGIK